MKHITDTNIEQNEPTAVTLGNFDGVHMGHRELISLTKKFSIKKNLKSVVFTFYPHPMFIFKNKAHSALILSPYEKKLVMENMNIDIYIEYPFTTDFAKMEPEDFINDIIFNKLNCRVLIVGENYKFGKKQSGNYDLLKKLGEDRGIKVIKVPSVLYNNSKVSSTRIRECIIEKNIDMANILLTSPYFLIGNVSKGKQLGRTIGFPTINIFSDKVKLFPPNGVYVTQTLYDNKLYNGVTNIGMNPTVNGKFRVIETFLFDFNKVIYGEFVKTYFFKWIRDEKKFLNIDDLSKQINKDVYYAYEYFKSNEFKKWKFL